jgi:hypothetical protein
MFVCWATAAAAVEHLHDASGAAGVMPTAVQVGVPPAAVASCQFQGGVLQYLPVCDGVGSRCLAGCRSLAGLSSWPMKVLSVCAPACHCNVIDKSCNDCRCQPWCKCI